MNTSEPKRRRVREWGDAIEQCAVVRRGGREEKKAVVVGSSVAAADAAWDNNMVARRPLDTLGRSSPHELLQAERERLLLEEGVRQT
ncbi:hypothetical protein QR680_001073 [Steinernema hermaphroditum]|uniref:Uncharacterized protein n=1 Tax=Steinernema hermaphroditum TaxID=289476 RepID=A0AA39LES3_9BILA|nr:hypothetical protein QR680_001073 [Steinernema hermaphroditum]